MIQKNNPRPEWMDIWTENSDGRCMDTVIDAALKFAPAKSAADCVSQERIISIALEMIENDRIEKERQGSEYSEALESAEASAEIRDITVLHSGKLYRKLRAQRRILPLTAIILILALALAGTLGIAAAGGVRSLMELIGLTEPASMQEVITAVASQTDALKAILPGAQTIGESASIDGVTVRVCGIFGDGSLMFVLMEAKSDKIDITKPGKYDLDFLLTVTGMSGSFQDYNEVRIPGQAADTLYFVSVTRPEQVVPKDVSEHIGDFNLVGQHVKLQVRKLAYSAVSGKNSHYDGSGDWEVLASADDSVYTGLAAESGDIIFTISYSNPKKTIQVVDPISMPGSDVSVTALVMTPLSIQLDIKPKDTAEFYWGSDPGREALEKQVLLMDIPDIAIHLNDGSVISGRNHTVMLIGGGGLCYYLPGGQVTEEAREFLRSHPNVQITLVFDTMYNPDNIDYIDLWGTMVRGQ